MEGEEVDREVSPPILKRGREEGQSPLAISFFRLISSPVFAPMTQILASTPL
jgi:hypothetical protein